ncbi:hypothetical protein [Mammaliicoccus sciuri]|uniref:DoxX family protein n=1 Tax=Mammaliicoccus sciuri TaxID=1296 RepID=A0AAI8DG02_MAMSC|nr:hypothetical protein [Mammaliicoccus sciuri]OOV37519.1 hypothetical protein BS756_11430 [Staphylococcus sp. MB371]ASE34362.1 hypothetical protein CEP64_07125 [Mammaliicoccus sciuri]MBO3080786.1 hypothetical protein [Mammaliicoccus sciuri]MCD8861114.1 hypothetical protein [Mammaliicoccus sciuri]MCO4322926.1 hypothetical protein [Mammaliicoccus sciuri]
MQTMIVYFVGCFIGFIVHRIFQTESMWMNVAQFSIFLAFMYTFIGRFMPSIRNSLIKMVPSSVPNPKMIVYVTGWLEFVIAISVFIPKLNMVFSVIGIILCFVLFPGNIKAHAKNISLGDKAPTNIYLRAFLQILFIVSFIIIFKHA